MKSFFSSSTVLMQFSWSFPYDNGISGGGCTLGGTLDVDGVGLFGCGDDNGAFAFIPPLAAAAAAAALVVTVAVAPFGFPFD